MDSEIFTSCWYFVHNFGYRYARKSFKGCKDADFGLFSEKSWAIVMAQWIRVQGQVKVAKTTPTCGILPRKPPTENEIFFSILTNKTCWSRKGFEQLSSSNAWRVIGLQSSAWNVVFAGLKKSYWNFSLSCSLTVISLQDLSWDRLSDRKFRKWLVFNHKYAGSDNLGDSLKCSNF